jgi:glyoxylase-like metal-dependent hydrolase (beta-lactamase superfamily II)
MYELVKVTERFYFVDCPAKIGIYKISDREIALIDSGNNKGAANKVLRIAEENGWQIRMILVTHAHCDHIGGCLHIKSRTGCKVYAPRGELGLLTHPPRGNAILYGAKPPKELSHGFLFAPACEAEALTDAVMPEGLSVLPLPGHSEDEYGFATDDGAVYLADALASRATLEKYGIPYVYDVGIYRETLERIAAMQGARFVSAHSEMTEDIAPLAGENIRKTEELISVILEEVSEPIAFEGLLERIFSRYGLTMSLEQYLLVGSTLRSYLTYLSEVDKITHTVKDRMLCWVKREEREE